MTDSLGTFCDGWLISSISYHDEWSLQSDIKSTKNR